MCKIKWINKFSQETGFVESIEAKEKHFVNTFDEGKAKKFKTAEAAQKAIDKLVGFGEAEANDFVIC